MLTSGFGAPFGTPTPTPDLAKSNSAAGRNLAGFDLRVDRRARHDDHVVAFACGQPFLRVKSPGENSRDLVPGGLFKLGDQLAIRFFCGLCRQNFQFSGNGHGGKHQRRGGNNGPFHASPLTLCNDLGLCFVAQSCSHSPVLASAGNAGTQSKAKCTEMEMKGLVMPTRTLAWGRFSELRFTHFVSVIAERSHLRIR